jgi:hypothetical protein
MASFSMTRWGILVTFTEASEVTRPWRILNISSFSGWWLVTRTAGPSTARSPDRRVGGRNLSGERSAQDDNLLGIGGRGAEAPLYQVIYGVPEEFIAYIGSMVGRPIEYYSCFISYSTKDQAFADRLYAAPHDIMGGRKIHEQIDEAIRVHDKLLLILHPSKRKGGVRR